MIKQRYWTAIPVVGCMVMLAGCSQAMTDAFFATSVAESRKFHKVTQDSVKEHDDNMTAQHKRMHPEAAADIDKLKAEYDAKFAKLKERDDNIHSAVGEVVRELTARFADLAPGGSISGFVTSLVGTETGKVKADAKNARTVILASLKALSDELDEESRTRMAEIAAMEKEATARLAALKEETQEKLAGTTKETFEQLVAAKDDRAEFEKIMREKLKFTPDEIENLKGMTTEQILALIAAAGGAAVVGVAGGRSGKSRGHAELERLKEMLAKVKAEIERAKPPVT